MWSALRPCLAVSNKPLSLEVLENAEEAADRLDHWRSNLLLLAAESLRDISESSFLGHELRAAAIVASMAEVEHLVREFLVSLSAEINASGTLIRNLKRTLRPLAVHSNFESLTTTSKGDTAWEQRLLVTTLEDNDQIARFPPRSSKGPQPPLDGKTIRRSHMLRLWEILGLPGTPFPEADCSTSLEKLALLRNDIAHRNVSVREVFFQPDTSARDVAKYLDDIVLMVLHLGTVWSSYASTRAYRV